MAPRFPLFATAARGTESLLVAELEQLGAARIRQDRGGVRFHANWDEALNICLWTRIAMRVLVPLGEFQVVGGEGLYDAAAQIPWEDHLSETSTFAVDSSLKDSEHAHSGFVSLKIKDAIVDRLRQKLGSRPDVDTKNPQVRVVAHLAKQTLTLSLDFCGDALYRRGYRVRPTVAPLKETLAAAIIRASGYTGEQFFLDPMCGSGTLLIEAGMVAVNRAPGLNRDFAIERWPHAGAEAKEILNELRNQARQKVRKALRPLVGLDKEPEAIEAAVLNIAAAKLSDEIAVQVGDATEPLPVSIENSGILVTNPPYGDRLQAGGQKGMKTFYFKLGDNFRGLSGWKLFILSGNPAFESAFHARPVSRLDLWNGPIECQLLEYSL